MCNPGGLFLAPLGGYRGREPHEFVDELVNRALPDVEGEQFLGVLAIEARLGELVERVPDLGAERMARLRVAGAFRGVPLAVRAHCIQQVRDRVDDPLLLALRQVQAARCIHPRALPDELRRGEALCGGERAEPGEPLLPA